VLPMIDDPIGQLHRSLAAQRAIASIPDISRALIPLSSRMWRDVRRALAAQQGVASALGDIAASVRESQLRVMKDITSELALGESALRNVQQSNAAASGLNGVISGRVWVELSAILRSTAPLASQLTQALRLANEAGRPLGRDYNRVIRAVVETRNLLSQEVSVARAGTAIGSASAALRSAGVH
jgi:hypothetical protein